MAANGQLVFTDVDKVTFKGVGNTSNAVIDTITGKLGVGVDSPDANLHIIGNCFVSTDLTASTLSGNGSGLTALNATNITTGTLDAARIPVLDAAKITSGTFAQARIPLLSGVTGVFDPNVDDIKIGNGAGTTSQGSNSVAVGHDAGKTSQGTQAVAVGYLAGNGTQGDNAVAVGIQAGSTGQGDNAIAVGRQAGVTSQGDNAVAVGYLAGNDTQGTSAVAVGIQAGQSDQGDDAIAIGHYSGQTNQGNKAVAVGYAAGLTDQHANSIILNASGVTLDSGGASRFYVKPIRAATEASNVVTYNATTGEVLDCKGITVNTLGHVTAIKILGDGSGLTALSALNVTTGLLDTLRIPDLPASKITSGTLPVTRGGTGTTTSTGTGSVVLSAAPAFTGDVTFDTDTLKIDSTNNRVGIGTDTPLDTLHVDGGTRFAGHIIPTANEQYDIGSAAFKIRDMYVSDNSLWIGDEAKISFTGNQIKFRRRKKSVVPSGLTTLGAAHSKDAATVQSEALASASGVSIVADMKLHHWMAYAKSLDTTKTTGDIFTDSADDYEASAASEAFKEVGSDIYSAHNVSIGKSTAPTTALDVNGTVTATAFVGAMPNLDATKITTGTLDRNTTGSAAKLTATVDIGGVSFDGSADIVPTTFGGATFSGDVAFNTNTLKIDSTTNRVGIGTISPLETCDIHGVSRISAAYPKLEFYTTPRTGSDTWGNSTNAAGDYRIHANGDASDGTKRSLNFDYGQNSVHTSRMVINAAGNVGIGTTSPVGVNGGQRLEGSSSTGFEYIATRDDTTGNSGDFVGAYLFKNADIEGNEPHYAGMSSKLTGTNGPMDLRFHTNRDKYEDEDGIPQMIIDAAGNVGIGTDAPQATLDVVGDVVISGRIECIGMLNLPRYTSDPATAVTGDVYFNTTLKIIRCYNGDGWGNVSNAPPEPTGGTVVITGQATGTSLTYNLGIDFEDDQDSDTQLTYTLQSGTLPIGSSLPSAGASTMSGTLTTAGTFNFTVRATDTGSQSSLQSYQIVVSNPPPEPTGGTVVITSQFVGTSLTYNLGIDFEDDQDSDTQLTYTLQSGTLPTGSSLPSAGASTVSGTLTTAGTFNFTVRATDTGSQASLQIYQMVVSNAPPGEAVFQSPGTSTWVAPSGVVIVSVVCVGGGGASGKGTNFFGAGGAGGGLAYKNNVTVVPGTSYTVTVGAGGAGYSGSGVAGSLSSANGGNSGFLTTVAGGGQHGGGNGNITTSGQPVGGAPSGTYDGGGTGGRCEGGHSTGAPYISSGGGGAGGYSGAGGKGAGSLDAGGTLVSATAGAGGGGGGGGSRVVTTNDPSYGGAGGGGVGLNGQGANGAAGLNDSTAGLSSQVNVNVGGGGGSGGGRGNLSTNTTGTGGVGGLYGGGAGSSHGPMATGIGAAGGNGAVRIMWGPGRSFPSNAA